MTWCKIWCIAKNPFENTTLPKIKRKPREIWDAATIRKALDECKDGRLYVAINLSFACSLRIGEIVGLTWDNIHISDADIASDNAYLCVEKELVRVREDSLAVLGEEEIIKKFPRTMYLEDASTVIVLKTPKTESSVRKVWIPKTVAYMGYLSHQADTCGLHVHVNRTTFGNTENEQEAAIARVLYFFEKFWEELLKFSRRTQRQLDHWAARYGYKEKPKDILDHAKGHNSAGRYTAVNLTNRDTVEFRMFRGTLKYNTLIATLELLDNICEMAVYLTDKDVQGLSWTSFVVGCTQPELVQYLKERRLYVNDAVASEEDV